jgi:hypothetical protein
VQTFEEAIRDHLRLRHDELASDEQLAELLGPSSPPDGGVDGAERQRRAQERRRRNGRGDGGANGIALWPRGRNRTARDRTNGATPETPWNASARARRNGAGGALWLRETEAEPATDGDAPPEPRLARLARAWRSLIDDPRAFLALQAVLALMLAVLVAAVLTAFDGDRIAAGVRVGGIPVGGLTVEEAHGELEGRLVAAARRPLVARAGERSWTFRPNADDVSVDVSGAVRAALDRSHAGGFPARVLRALPGGGLETDVAPPVAFRGPNLDRFVGRVARAVDRAPRDASVRPAGSRLAPIRDRPGTAVDRGALESILSQRMASATAPRALSVPRRTIPAKVETSDLRAKYRHYVLIRRDDFRLDYFRGMRLVRSYPIAVGMEGLDTPAGMYEVQGKQINPSWLVPTSKWAGDKAGQLVPPGPDNPIKARWLGFNGSAGIHGTADVGSLGSRASHGCVRMSIPDVKDLYRRVPVHAPVRVD